MVTDQTDQQRDDSQMSDWIRTTLSERDAMRRRALEAEVKVREVEQQHEFVISKWDAELELLQHRIRALDNSSDSASIALQVQTLRGAMKSTRPGTPRQGLVVASVPVPPPEQLALNPQPPVASARLQATLADMERQANRATTAETKLKNLQAQHTSLNDRYQEILLVLTKISSESGNANWLDLLSKTASWQSTALLDQLKLHNGQASEAGQPSLAEQEAILQKEGVAQYQRLQRQHREMLQELMTIREEANVHHGAAENLRADLALAVQARNSAQAEVTNGLEIRAELENQLTQMRAERRNLVGVDKLVQRDFKLVEAGRAVHAAQQRADKEASCRIELQAQLEREQANLDSEAAKEAVEARNKLREAEMLNLMYQKLLEQTKQEIEALNPRHDPARQPWINPGTSTQGAPRSIKKSVRDHGTSKPRGPDDHTGPGHQAEFEPHRPYRTGLKGFKPSSPRATFRTGDKPRAHNTSKNGVSEPVQLPHLKSHGSTTRQTPKRDLMAD
eukprot:TRINITY_DN11787_c0_g1_i2.p1 TRINITY_DN11787_c0_g1~~TRINITY_DN11787_c0_g1_i2.p1  ORF type:complete len:507 (-),score=99.79 TRINITY_DN11787_c0_g1_i2:232-1752(-)